VRPAQHRISRPPRERKGNLFVEGRILLLSKLTRHCGASGRLPSGSQTLASVSTLAIELFPRFQQKNCQAAPAWRTHSGVANLNSLSVELMRMAIFFPHAIQR
jgi:hypothetical protein